LDDSKCALDISAHQQLESMCKKIIQQVDRTNQMIDLILASARMEYIDESDFRWSSMRRCVAQTLDNYPFNTPEKNKVFFEGIEDFEFYGSPELMEFLLSNLLKNAIYAMKSAEKGEIFIEICHSLSSKKVVVMDTACGISKNSLPLIFDTYYSTKKSAGAGVGLSFCLRVMKAFGGDMECESVLGEFTKFTLNFPLKIKNRSKADQQVNLNISC
jgi:two-component system, CAI-1 autoinducer sensor kinase/phosphatase CqsS